MIEILEFKISEYRVDLNKCYKSKAAIQKISQATNADERSSATLAKTINSEINDYKSKIEDLEDDILALKQYENPQSKIVSY